ncbi:MAG: right-handed parallel beta-helix repeat-containing protein [Verrucomicrobiae bacterium]|nr:right-handed parallel beta-helix repeat-containing protein [Verrucomicrobiae bacterium]
MTTAPFSILTALGFAAISVSLAGAQTPISPSAADYPSLQEAIDANPGKAVFVPSGEHRISEKLRLKTDGSGLWGTGRIVMENADRPIIEIESAAGVEIRGVTLTRAEDTQETNAEGIIAIECRDLTIEGVKVIDNHTRSGAITLRNCRDTSVSRCLVRNYMRVTMDDRTASPDWGYAFHCTDGTGISVSYSTGTLIEGNRILEERLRPTPELQAQHHLGDFAKRNPEKGSFVSPQTWEAGHVDNWQQGSGIIVTAPEASDLTRILGNQIENAAQGIDLHADHVIVANNVITNSFMGMKAMHGSRNVLITGNQFHRNCLWAIGLMPGAAAHEGNADGGSIVANNLISDFGEGDAAWIWGTDKSPFKFDTGQQDDDPPLSEVLVQGNVVHHTGEPHYRYAVILPEGPRAPHGLHFSNNLFLPGTDGISNHDLPQ